MIASLSAYMKAAVGVYMSTDRKEFVKTHPGQIVATVCQIQWSTGVADAIEERGLAVAERDVRVGSRRRVVDGLAQRVLPRT